MVPFVQTAMFMALADATISDKGYTADGTTHTGVTLTLSQSLIDTIVSMVEDAGMEFEYPPTAGTAQSIPSFTYSKLTSGTYAYKVSMIIEDVDTSSGSATYSYESTDIQWTSDLSAYNLSYKSVDSSSQLTSVSAIETELASYTSYCEIVFDGDAQTMSSVYWFSGSGSSDDEFQILMDGSSGFAVGLYEPLTLSYDPMYVAYADDNGCACDMYNGTGTTTFAFDTDGADLDSSSTAYSSYTGAIATAKTTLASITRLTK